MGGQNILPLYIDPSLFFEQTIINDRRKYCEIVYFITNTCKMHFHGVTSILLFYLGWAGGRGPGSKYYTIVY